MIKADELVLAGRINKTHGVNGELSVTFVDEALMDVIVPDECLIMQLDGIFVPFFVSTVRSRGNSSLLITLDGEDTRERASRFVGMDVYVKRQLADTAFVDDDMQSDGMYAAQLIGYSVVSDDGSAIGIVSDIDESSPDNPLFVVTTGEQRVVYIPIVDDFITDIDIDRRVLTMDLPIGLIDLN